MKRPVSDRPFGWRQAAVLALTAARSAPVLAQQPDPPITDETPPASGEENTGKDPRVFHGDITVEDSPIVAGSEVDGLGSLVATVTEQQIDDLYAQDLTSALRRVPGVVISR